MQKRDLNWSFEMAHRVLSGFSTLSPRGKRSWELGAKNFQIPFSS